MDTTSETTSTRGDAATCTTGECTSGDSVDVVESHGPGPAVAIVRPVGELDMLTAPELRTQLAAQLEQCGHLILDLSEVTFLSAAGLHVMVETHHRAGARGAALHLTGAHRRLIARPLAITGLHRVLTIDTTPAAVLEKLVLRP